MASRQDNYYYLCCCSAAGLHTNTRAGASSSCQAWNDQCHASSFSAVGGTKLKSSTRFSCPKPQIPNLPDSSWCARASLRGLGLAQMRMPTYAFHTRRAAL